MKSLIISLILLTNISFIHSQSEGKTKKNKGNENILENKIVLNEDSLKTIFPKNDLKKDSLQYYKDIQIGEDLSGYEKYLLESVRNLSNVLNYKPGFYNRYFNEKDFVNKLYNPDNDQDFWRIDSDIEIAKLFLYFTKDKDSANDLKKVIYNNTVKKQLFEINRVFEEKPDSINRDKKLFKLNEINDSLISEGVIQEKNRLLTKLSTFQNDECEMITQLSQLNNLNRENANFSKVLKEYKSKYSYSPYLLGLIEGIEKQKVEENYFIEIIERCKKDHN